ncbi:hypothetical protein B566_EDAN004693, partial [Ephemera danica]
MSFQMSWWRPENLRSRSYIHQWQRRIPGVPFLLCAQRKLQCVDIYLELSPGYEINGTTVYGLRRNPFKIR